MSTPYQEKRLAQIRNRFTVLIGEMQAGNNQNPAIQKEFVLILKGLVRHKVITVEESDGLLKRYYR
jgi:hypothetical protein